VAYLKARDQQTPAWDTFQKIKLQSDLLDLGQDRFMHTERHNYEVDLWKYIKAINFMTSKLSLSQVVPAATEKPATSRAIEPQYGAVS
jgi:hypothetical protein